MITGGYSTPLAVQREEPKRPRNQECLRKQPKVKNSKETSAPVLSDEASDETSNQADDQLNDGFNFYQMKEIGYIPLQNSSQIQSLIDKCLEGIGQIPNYKQMKQCADNVGTPFVYEKIERQSDD